ncbi:MAG: TIGR02217 family protein [Hyphomicrobiaceae bacterium]
MSFHETRFPTDISRGAQGGPERRTDVVVLGSGFEERNSRWANSRRAWNAGYGIKSLDDLHAVIAFFEERRGKLYGFRWKDHADFKSCPPQSSPTALDQQIGIGTGVQSTFQLAKRYGTAFAPWDRDIAKPVAGSVQVAVNGLTQTPGTDFGVAAATGIVTFLPGHIPPADAVVTAGFEFDVPARFDTDKLDLDLRGFQHGAIPSIPIVEIRV